MAALTHWIASSHEYLHQLGWLGILLYALVIVFAQLFLTPLSPLAVGGGFIFGMQGGLIAITLGTGVGAAINFLISKHLARGAMMRRIGGNRKFQIIDKAIGEEGWRIIFLLRFCPVPFGFANYAYGLTAVGFWPYLLPSVVAIIPANCFFVWLGATAQAGLEAVLGSNRPRHPFEYAMMGFGLLACFTAMFYLGKVARTALAKHSEPGIADA